MARGTLLYALLFSLPLLAQKKVEKTIFDYHHLSSVQINAKNCYAVTVSTHASKEIIIKAHAEGEYQNAINITTKQIQNELQVGAVRSPFVWFEDDKLAAHKVISISLEVVLPRYLSIIIHGNDGVIYTKGTFKNIDETSDDGDCFLEDIIAENINIQTFNGNIFLKTDNGSVQAKTKYGKLKQEVLPFDDEKYSLTSVNGDIYISKQTRSKPTKY